MEWLNYHHLLYFWMVAREGSIARACEELNLAQPTISGQLRSLEESLGEQLFTRVGRRLLLTETGQLVFQYADEIFGLGRELNDVLKGRPRGRPLRLTVGISDLIPKLIAYRVLQPAFALKERVQLVCYEDQPDQLLLDLSAHRLDLVLSHTPSGSAVPVRVFSHRLGSCGVSLFAASALAARYRKAFPAHLDGAPFLLPMERSASRRALEQMVRRQRDSSTNRRRVSGQRAAGRVRSSGCRYFRGAQCHRKGSPPNLQGIRNRQARLRVRGILRDLRRAQDQTSGRSRHHRDCSKSVVRGMIRVITRALLSGDAG